MIRALTAGTVAAASAMAGWSSLPTNPDACKLLSLADATAVIGPPLALKHTESSATFSTCAYGRASQNPLDTPEGVEVHYFVLGDVASAQAKFQRVVHPGPMAGTTVTAVPNLGDEADIKRTPDYKVNSIEFRRGAAIVTISVSPIVGDSTLKAAAVKAMSHM